MDSVDGSVFVFAFGGFMAFLVAVVTFFVGRRAREAQVSRDEGDGAVAYQDYYRKLIADLRDEIAELRAKVEGLEKRETERELELLRARAKVGELFVEIEELRVERDAAVAALTHAQDALKEGGT